MRDDAHKSYQGRKRPSDLTGAMTPLQVNTGDDALGGNSRMKMVSHWLTQGRLGAFSCIAPHKAPPQKGAPLFAQQALSALSSTLVQAGLHVIEDFGDVTLGEGS